MHNLRHFAAFDPSYASFAEPHAPCLSSLEYHATGISAQPSHGNVWLPCPSTTAKQSAVAPPSCEPALPPCAVGPSSNTSTHSAAGLQPGSFLCDATASQQYSGMHASASSGMTDAVYIPAHLQRPHAPLRCQLRDLAVSALLAQSVLAPADPNLISILRGNESASEDPYVNSALQGSGLSGSDRSARGSGWGQHSGGTALPPCFSHPQANCAPSVALEEVFREGSQTGGLFTAGEGHIHHQVPVLLCSLIPCEAVQQH